MSRVWELWGCIVYKSKDKCNLMSDYWQVYGTHFSQNEKNKLKLGCVEGEFKTGNRKCCLYTIQTFTLKYNVVLVIFLIAFQSHSVLFNN